MQKPLGIHWESIRNLYENKLIIHRVGHWGSIGDLYENNLINHGGRLESIGNSFAILQTSVGHLFGGPLGTHRESMGNPQDIYARKIENPLRTH